MTFGHNEKAYKNTVNGKTKPSKSSKNTIFPQIRPEILIKALLNTTMFLPHGLQSERDLIGSMEFLVKMKVHEGYNGMSIESYHL